MSVPSLNGILETSLYVGDLARSVAFYEQIFGFPVLHGTPRMCAMDAGVRQVLLLFLKGGSAAPVQSEGGMIPGHDGEGRLHLSFAIDAATLEEWKSWLEQNGVSIESAVDWARGGKSLYFRDPDANLLELATPGLWSSY